MLPAWTPELATLDLLLSVAEHGSVGGAAAVHGISQPSASERISRLERRLGLRLLVRSTRGSSLTPDGEVVVAWAAQVVASAQALTDGVQSLRRDVEARLRVGASLTVAEYLMPPWLLALRRRHPDVEVAATVANSRQVAEQVRAGEVDLGFVETPELPRGVTGQHIGSDRIVLVVAPSSPLSVNARQGLEPAELPQLPLLIREPGSGTRDTFLHALAAVLGEEPELPRATELGSTATILATARVGGGVAVLSARAVAAEVGTGHLVELPVRGLTAERPLTAIWLGRRPSQLGEELVTLAAQVGS